MAFRNTKIALRNQMQWHFVRWHDVDDDEWQKTDLVPRGIGPNEFQTAGCVSMEKFSILKPVNVEGATN